MKLKELYDAAVRAGIEGDPRGEGEIETILAEAKRKYDKLDADDKATFDSERLVSPYADTRILAGAPQMEVTGILVGVDMEVGEILLADRLRERGSKINVIMAHHPEGRALAGLDQVMAMQADVWNSFGVPINIGEALMGPRMSEVRRNLMPINHARAVDAARLLDFGFLCVHTPADNLATKFVQEYLNAEKPRTLRDVVRALKRIPEYEQAALEGAGPNIIVGDADKRAGKIAVDMTGGTEGPEGAIEKLADAGVGTLVGMHYGEKLRKKADEKHINLVVAGHIASDAVGINQVLDKIAAADGSIEITPCSGLRRVKRN